MKFEHLDVPDENVRIEKRGDYVLFDINVSDKYDAEYLFGLRIYDYICIDGKYYRVIETKISGNSVKILCEDVSYKRYKIVSENEAVSNDLGITGQPVITVPSNTAVLYTGASVVKEGNVDIYLTDEIELVEAIPLSMKIYDDMNSDDENDWKLVSDPVNHKFIGKFVFEYGGMRLRQNRHIYVYNGEWIDVVYLFKIFNDRDDNRNYVYGKITNVDRNLCEVKHPTYSYFPPHYYVSRDLLGEGLMIKNDDDSNVSVVRCPRYVHYSGEGSIAVNSDFVVKTAGHESDYILYSGSGGWVFEYFVPEDSCCVHYYTGNCQFLSSNGWGGYSKVTATKVFPEYIGKIFNNAEDGVIANGQIVQDDGAVGGYAVQGLGEDSSLHVDIIRSWENIPGGKVPAGEYKVIFRVKANTTSANDKISLNVYNATTKSNVVSKIVSAEDIGTGYKCFILDWSYDGSYDYAVWANGVSNVDGTLFNIDYALVVPIGEIRNNQSRAFIKNRQRLVIE